MMKIYNSTELLI